MIQEPCLPSLCFLLPGLLQQDLFQPCLLLPMAYCHLQNAHSTEIRSLPSALYFLPCDSPEAVQDNLQSLGTGSALLSQSCSLLWEQQRRVRVRWCWQEVRGEQENRGEGQPTLTLKSHLHLCHFTLRTHALQRQNFGREQLSTDPAQSKIRYKAHQDLALSFPKPIYSFGLALANENPKHITKLKSKQKMCHIELSFLKGGKVGWKRTAHDRGLSQDLLLLWKVLGSRMSDSVGTPATY